MINKQTKIAAGVMLFVFAAATFLWPKSFDVKLCNGTPFATHYVLALQLEGQNVTANGATDRLAHLPPGGCVTKEITLEDGKGEVSYFARMKNGRDQWLQGERELFNYVSGLPASNDKNIIWSSNGPVMCLQNSYEPGSRVQKAEQCSGGSSPVRPITVALDEDTPLIDDTYFIMLASPGLAPINASDFEDAKGVTASLSKKMPGLRKIYTRHLAFNAKWRGHEVPLHLGASLKDENGPLSSGVVIQNPRSFSIFGDPLPYQNEDVLYRINQTDVFAPADVFQALIDHGFTHAKGITEPIKVTFARGDKLISANSSYFFNERYHRFNYDAKDDAMYYGVIDALSLGLAAEANCTAKNAPNFVANKLYWLAEQLDSSKKRPRVGYHDFDECVWNAENEIALAQQKHKDVYTNSAWLTIFTPNAPRLLLAKGLEKKIARNGLRGATGALAATATLELLETGVFFINDRSPLQSYADVARDFSVSIPYIAGITLSLGVLSKIR